MTQGFSFAEAFQPPTQTDEPGGFSFADALGVQPAPAQEPAAPGTFVSPGGAAFVPPKSGIRKPKAEAAPTPEPEAPKEPKPYRDRREALDDAVNLLEEGYDQKQVVEGFKKLGITMDEITRHGQKRKSEYFRQQAPLPPSKEPVAPAQPTGEIKAFEPGMLETVANTFKRADASFGDMATGFLFSTGAFDPDQAAWSLRRNARQRAAAAPSEDVQRGMEAIGGAKTYGDAVTAMYKNPKATFNMLVDSLLVTAPTLAATLALAPAGAAVRAGTTFAGSGGMEYTSVMADVLQDKGIDLMDAPKVAKALTDPKIIQEMKDKGAKRGLIVGAFDALSMGLAGRFMRPANELIAAGKLSGAAAKKATVAAWGKEVALQAGAGSGGEFLAQQATGEDRPAEVLLEGLAEIATAPLDVQASLREARDLEVAAQQAAQRGQPPVAKEITPERAEPTGFSFEEAKAAPEERIEPGFDFEAAQAPEAPAAAPAAPAAAPQRVVRPADLAEEAVPGMPTGEELEMAPEAPAAPSLAEQAVAAKEAAPAPVAEAAPDIEQPAAEAPAAPTATFKPTEAAAALPEAPVAAPVVETKLPEPAPVNMEAQGLPIQEVPLTELKLSKDVPQFKIGASEKGVVEPLGGKFERTGVAPIQVWERNDGTLEVISGRHRFDLAQRSGEQTIPAQIHREADGFGQLQAAILDAELNIRDGQGKVKDYVNYFKESGIDREDAESRGLLARATGKRSFAIANQGSEELVAAVRADQIGDEAAYYIALNAPGDSRLQSVGIKAIQDGKSANTATNMMQAVKALAGEQDTTTDMFGFDDSAIKEAEEMAKIASQKQREIQTRLSAISGAAKNPAVAKAEGIDIKDPEAVKRRIDELRQMKASWDNWSTNPQLVAEIRQARGVPAPELAPIEQPVEAPAAEAGPGLFEQPAEQLADTTDTPAEEAAQIADEDIRAKLMRVADNLGVRVFETSDRPMAGEGYVAIPTEDKLAENMQSAEQVFAHELGHAIMQKRGMAFNQMPHEQVAKWIKGWPQIREISKAFRPEVYKSKMPKMRRHANKPDEIIADALGAFLLDQVTFEQIKPLTEGIGLSEYDLGLKKSVRREMEDKALSEIEAKNLLKAQTEDELRQKAEREAAEAKRVKQEEQEAERKAQADREVGEFVLTGSDRAADEAAARGQQDIFGIAEEAAAEPTWSDDTGPAKRGDRRRFTIDTPKGSVEVDLDFSERPGLASAMRGDSISSSGFRSIIGEVNLNEARAMADPMAFASELVASAQAEQEAVQRKATRTKKAAEKPADAMQQVRDMAERLLAKGTEQYAESELDGKLYQVRTRTFTGKLFGSELRLVQDAIGSATDVTLINTDNQVMTLQFTGKYVGEGRNVRIMDSQYTAMSDLAAEPVPGAPMPEPGMTPSEAIANAFRKEGSSDADAQEMAKRIQKLADRVDKPITLWWNPEDGELAAASTNLFDAGVAITTIEPTPDPRLAAEKQGKMPLANIEIREEQIKEYAKLRAKLARVPKAVAEGKTDLEMQETVARMMQQARELNVMIKATKPRRDSAEKFLAKALTEFDNDNITEDVLKVIQAAYQKHPELLEGLLLSVKARPEGRGQVAGEFVPWMRIVRLYKGTSGTTSPVTARHELTHSLEQMMTPEQRMAVVQAWGKALARAIKQNPDKLHQKYFNAVLDFLDKPSERTMRLAQNALPSYDMYQFINPSEFWAVNAEKLMAAQLGGAWDKFKRAIRRLWEGMKKVLGFDNRYDIHRVFGQVMTGSKDRITEDMLVDMVRRTGDEFVTLDNIDDDKKLMEKYNRPHTPQLDTTPIKTFITRQFKNGKEFFQDAAENPREAMVGAGDSVMDGLIYLRNKNVWYGSGLEARDFDRYNGELRTSEGFATGSVALDNAIRSGNIGVEVIFRGGIKFDPKSNTFVAVERELGMKGVYEAEKALKDKLGEQLGTDIIQGYLEAKRSISIMNELYEREAAFESAKENLRTLREMGADEEQIAEAKAVAEELSAELDSIKKAASSVNMSEEEMYEFAALDKKHPELRDIMDNWTAINQNLLRFWRQVGLLSQGRYDTLSAIKDYVPWYRIMADEEDVHSPLQATTRSLTNIGREKLFKRGKPLSVVDFRAKDGQKDFKIQPSSVVKVEVNGKPVAEDLVSVTPSGDVRIDMDLKDNDLVVFKTNREIENIIDNMTRNVMRMTMNGIRQYAANRIVLEYGSRNEKGKIMTFPSVDKDKGRFNWTVNGKKVVVEIQDPLVASSIYGMENLNLQMWAPLAAVANLTRRSITLSGVFQLKQVFKDAPTAALVTGVKNPMALIGGVWKGFLTSLVNADPAVDILKAAGIGGFHSPARTPEAEIKRRLGIMNRNVFSAVIKGLDHIGDASDMAQRVAVYKRVLAETGDETQALYQAANVINFMHHGAAGYAQAAVKVVPFLGAYANAMDVLVRALMGGGLKGMSRQKALARLTITMSMLVSLTLLYAMLAGADPEYDELDDQTKLKNIIIPGTKIMLPMNTSAAYFFKAIPELIYNKVTRDGTENEYDRRRLRKALGDAARDMLLGPEPIPAGVKPIFEVAINHDFFTGRPVIPEGLKNVEAAEQYTASTSELGKKLSAMLEIPGTDGKRVISPVEADHLVRGIFGTSGAMAQWVSNSIGAMAEARPEPTARETPITGSFLRDEVPRGREDLFYDFKEAVTQKYQTWQKMMDRGDFDAADEYIEKHGDVAAMNDYITEAETELKEINAEIRRIGETREKDMTPRERRLEIEDYKRLKAEILEPVKELRREVLK